MYYNTKFKLFNITISIVTILTAIFYIAKPNTKIMFPIIYVLLGLQQLLMGFNSFKLNKKIQCIISMSGSIILFLCSIFLAKFIVS